MHRFLTLSLPLALALCLAPLRSAHACKCMVATVEEARADASVIFEGRVLTVAEESKDDAMPVMRVTLALVRTWKGLDDKEQVEVRTNKDGAACGYEFAKDASYLVYAHENEGQLHVSSCSRTRPMSDASEDLAVLGAGVTPVSIKSRPGEGADKPPAPREPAAPAAPAKGARKRGCSVTPSEPNGDANASVVELAPIALFALLLGRRRRGSKRAG